jgi:hypothetical protein
MVEGLRVHFSDQLRLLIRLKGITTVMVQGPQQVILDFTVSTHVYFLLVSHSVHRHRCSLYLGAPSGRCGSSYRGKARLLYEETAYFQKYTFDHAYNRSRSLWFCYYKTLFHGRQRGYCG